MSVRWGLLLGFALSFSACGGSSVAGSTDDGRAGAGGAVAGAGGGSAGSSSSGGVAGSAGGAMGFGGVGGQGLAGAGGGAGVGAPPVGCDRLSDEGSRQVTANAPSTLRQPALGLTSDGRGVLAYIAAREGDSGYLTHEFFEPWEGWGSEPLVDGFPDHEVDDFVIGAATGSGERFAYLSRSSAGLWYSNEHGSGAFQRFTAGGPTARPLWVTRSTTDPGVHSLGYEESEAGLYRLVVGLGSYEGPNFEDNEESFACASSPLQARAVPVSDGFLIAASSGDSMAGCIAPSPQTPPRLIHIAHRTASGTQVVATLGDPQPGSVLREVDQVEWVATTVGAWLFWKYAAVSPGAFNPIYGVRVSEAGEPQGQAIEFARTDTEPDHFSVVTLGDGALFAIVTSLYAITPPAALVTVYGPGGELLAGREVWGESGLFARPPYSLLAEPGGSRLLLASGDDDRNLFVTQLRCVEEGDE